MRESVKRFIGCVILAGMACAVQAATRTWLSSSGGQWSDAANWQDGNLPGLGDVADLSAATGTIDIANGVTVGEIHYNPAFSGTTNQVTILSDTDAPSSQTITLAGVSPRRLRVAEGAELLLDVDLLSKGDVIKDGYGTLFPKRRWYSTSSSRYMWAVEQGRLINEGVFSAPAFQLSVGTVEPETGDVPELILRENSSVSSSTFAGHAIAYFGGNHLIASGTGSRGIVRHEGGVLDLTNNDNSWSFLNSYVAGGSSDYYLSGGEVNDSNSTAYVAFHGTGTVNQTGGKFKAKNMYFSYFGSSSGRGTYNLEGGELWLGGYAQRGGGVGSFNMGGGCIYPFNSGFFISSSMNPKFTDVGGSTRFCSTGSVFTNRISGVTGSGGFVKEGADTLSIEGNTHSFSGPIIVSNGTVNVMAAMEGNNAVTVAGGTLNIHDTPVSFSSLTVTGGVFHISSNSVFVLSGADPWARVMGDGTVRLANGSQMLRLDVSEEGIIDLTDSTVTVCRVRIEGVEFTNGYYNAENCTAIKGNGLLYVSYQSGGRPLIDTFSREDGSVVVDSLGQTEGSGGADWGEFAFHGDVANTASIVNDEMRVGVGNSDPGFAVASAYWLNGDFSTWMRFVRIGEAGDTIRNVCGLVMRRNVTTRRGVHTPSDWRGTVQVLMGSTGGLFMRQNYSTDYVVNPFTGSSDYLSYVAAGSLPTTINGQPFDADGNGRLDADEPFELRALLSGERLQVLINGEPVVARNGFTSLDASKENGAGLCNVRRSHSNDEIHDSYHDVFSVSNLPYVIRHVGSYNPAVTADTPLENWVFSGDTNLTPVGPISEMIGGEMVEAWQVNDPSTTSGAHYNTPLSVEEITAANTYGWRLTMRLRVVGANSPLSGSVCGQFSNDTFYYNLWCGSDASGNAKVKLANGSTHTVSGGSVYHTYEVEYDPDSGKASLSCDGNLLENNIAPVGGAYRRVRWGANSGRGTGNANYQDVQFSILWPDPPLAPRPPPPPPPAGTIIIIY